MRSKIANEACRALYILALALLMVMFFQLWRAILLFLLPTPAPPVPTLVLFKSFLIGTRFDLAVACYLLVPLAIIAFLPRIGLERSLAGRRLHWIGLALATGAAFLVQLADIEFFRFFRYRINGMALQWDETPGMVISMVWQTYPVIAYLILYALMLGAFLLCARWLRKWLIPPTDSVHLPARIIAGVATLVLLGLGMRGTLEEKAPLAWGAAYFSEYALANQLALNPNFTFARDVFWDAESARRVREIMEVIGPSTSQAVTSDATPVPTPRTTQLAMPQDTADAPSPNVILVIMESFGATRIGALDNRTGLDLSPGFDSLAQRGVLFTNCYSNGMHTYTGIVSTLFGIPTLPGESIMKRVVRGDHLAGLPSLLRDHGYRTLFFTTHDPHFDNMQGFLMAHGFEELISVFDYDPALKLSTLGVPDHVMFDRAIEELGTRSDQPFFATLLTSSNHGPWIIPEAPFDHIPDSVPDSERLNAFKYSDWALARFVSSVSQSPSLANSIIVVTADNGLPFNPITDLDPTQFHIPLLLLLPNRPDLGAMRNDNLAGQIDVLPTLAGLLGFEVDHNMFGRDLLADAVENSMPFAIFSEDFRVGYIERDHFLVWRYEARRSLFQIEGGDFHGIPESLPIADTLEMRALTLFRTAYLNVTDPPVAQDADTPANPNL